MAISSVWCRSRLQSVNKRRPNKVVRLPADNTRQRGQTTRTPEGAEREAGRGGHSAWSQKTDSPRVACGSHQ